MRKCVLMTQTKKCENENKGQCQAWRCPSFVVRRIKKMKIWSMLFDVASATLGGARVAAAA